jgi:hypothetical protein
MLRAKPILLLIVAAAIALYATDCGAMTTPDQAMQCCDTMPCSSHSPERSQECCSNMPSVHAPFLQPASTQGLSFSPVFVALLPGFDALPGLHSTANIYRARSHAPPISPTASLSPLRI